MTGVPGYLPEYDGVLPEYYGVPGMTKSTRFRALVSQNIDGYTLSIMKTPGWLIGCVTAVLRADGVYPSGGGGYGDEQGQVVPVEQGMQQGGKAAALIHFHHYS